MSGSQMSLFGRAARAARSTGAFLVGGFRGFLCAVGFLTVLPRPRSWVKQPEDFSQVPFWMPVVGSLIGAVAVLATMLAYRYFSPGIAAVTAVFMLAYLQGGLHLDGLADTFDGFFSCRSRERVLEIMKDSRIGTFGVLAIFLALALQLVAVLSMPPGRCWRVMFLAPVIGRATMVPSMLLLKSARPGGMGEMCAGGHLALALLPALGALVLPFRVLPQGIAVVAVFGTLLVYCQFVQMCRRRIGGYTGDTLGAGSEIVETAFMVFASIH